MGSGQLVVFLAGGAAVVAVAVYGWYRNQQRIEALAQFCLAKGWQFSARDDSLGFRWTGPPFDVGSDREARDVVSGTVGAEGAAMRFLAFDYSYVTESSNGKGGRSRTTHRYAVCAVGLPTFLPSLQITPETMLTRVGHAVGLEDIELESEGFNRRFWVSASSAKFASDVLPPRTMELLLARPPLHFRITGTDVLCWEEGTTNPTNLLARTSTLAGFVAGIPSFVWHDHGTEPPATPPVPPTAAPPGSVGP